MPLARQRDFESRATARRPNTCSHAHRSPVLPCDPFRERQAEPVALLFLGRVEGLEYPALMFERDAAAIIGHDDVYTVAAFSQPRRIPYIS